MTKKINKESKEEEQVYKFLGSGLTTTEKHWAESLFDDYKKHYHITTLSDLQLLEELCFRQTLQERVKKTIGKVAKGTYKKEKNITSKIHLQQLDDNLERILTLKDRLGLFDKKDKEDPYEYLKQLEKKFEEHRKENAGDYSLPCPFCSKMIFLMFKVKDYNAVKHPFFPYGKFITNDTLWELYKSGKSLTKEKFAEALGTSPDYIDHLATYVYKDSDKPSKVSTD